MPLADGSIDDAITVAEGLRANDLGCEVASVDEATEQVSCLIGDDLVSISRFADHAALVASEPMIRGAACFLAADKENVNLTYVEGDNWIVYPQQEATAHAIARALEARLRVIDCPTA
jgi:hypothetical protein